MTNIKITEPCGMLSDEEKAANNCSVYTLTFNTYEHNSHLRNSKILGQNDVNIQLTKEQMFELKIALERAIYGI